MSKIYIYKYNNYFNRITKKESTLTSYGTPEYSLATTNFNYNDGITTSHVCNYSGKGDYLIVCDNENNIESHWFITDRDKTRGGQVSFTLRRDLIVDNYDKVITAPMIISRAMITNPDNPLLFNTEGFSFNQIKRSETTLEDASESRWYYLYFKKDAPQKTLSVNLGGNAYDVSLSGTAASYFRYQDTPVDNVLINHFKLRTITGYSSQVPASQRYVTCNWYVNSNLSSNVNSEIIPFAVEEYHRIFFIDTYNNINNSVKNMLASNYNSLKNAYSSEITNDVVTDLEYEEWTALNGKKVKDSDNKIYLVTVSTSETTSDSYIQTDNYPLTRAIYENMIENSGIEYTDGLGTEALQIQVKTRRILVHLTDITAQSGAISFNLFDSTGNYVTTDDSEYKIISLPADRIVYQYNNADYYTAPNVMQKLIREISLNYPDYLVDIQLLPYCNYHETVYEGTVYPEEISTTQVQYLTHTDNNTQVRDGFIYYVDSANVSFNIYKSLYMGTYDTDSALNKKIANETEVWRLVSPNYDGTFEFSLAKNDNVNYFNVDITLKPYNPYIHINPNFKSLYGQDFDDARGLILNGDFSLPIETSAWADYELRNKNYQIAFNRQIEHMDFQHGQEKVYGIFNAITGTMSGTLTGAAAGGMAGGVPGAIAGGIAGGVTSLAGGIADLSMMGARQREGKDFAVDNFKFQLGNVKALPNSISKVTPLTYNNKKFPFVEKYTCTDEEVNILKNKILYTSMNVNAIGTIQEYMQTERTFIQGTLIRLEGTGLESHEIYEIFDELRKGVYI